MARKPNYQFERMERERLKSAKAAAKAGAKAAANQRGRDDVADPERPDAASSKDEA